MKNKDIKMLYDAECKNIISDKYVIANIIKDCIEEYRDLTIEEIIPLIDDGDVTNRYIKGLSLTNYEIAEGTVDFDSLFTIKDPSSPSKIGVFVNIEAQNNIYLNYDLLSRAEYYVSWLIIAQRKYNMFKTKYNELKSVYSIWLNLYPRKSKVNKIDFYTLLNKNDLKEKINSHINIVYYNVGKEYKYSLKENNNILEMLDILFHPNKDRINRKTKILKQKYHIIKRKEEVLNMCSLSAAIEYQGIQKGEIKAAMNLINSGMTKEDTFKLLKTSKSAQKIIKEKLELN